MGERFENAKKKWARKTSGAGDRWQKATVGKKTDYKKGVADFLGVSEGEIGKVAENWETEVSQSTAVSNYNTGVAGKENTWGENYRKKMTL